MALMHAILKPHHIVWDDHHDQSFRALLNKIKSGRHPGFKLYLRSIIDHFRDPIQTDANTEQLQKQFSTLVHPVVFEASRATLKTIETSCFNLLNTCFRDLPADTSLDPPPFPMNMKSGFNTLK